MLAMVHDVSFNMKTNNDSYKIVETSLLMPIS